MKVYRLITEPDSSAFCQRVTEALSKGWKLHGSPTMTTTHEGIVICGQAVVKKKKGLKYSADMKLGEQ